MKALIPIAYWVLFSLSQVAALPKGREDLQIEYSENHESYAVRRLDPEVTMTINEVIRYHGYPVEDFDVQTEDGYILTIQRIPYGKNGPGTNPRKPVIIQHGMTASSAAWVTNTPDKNLAYILADEGYDVWLTNVRGNVFGRKHVSLSPSSKAFWKFSWDEMAKYDMPAMIDFILQHTGFQQTLYIGHSMGTTMAFAMLASKPEYNKKVKFAFTLDCARCPYEHGFYPFVVSAMPASAEKWNSLCNILNSVLRRKRAVRGVMALAPAANLDHVRSPIKLLAPFANDFGFLITLLGNGEFTINSNILDFFSATVCNSDIKVLCSSVIFILCGFNLPQLNQTRLPVYLHFLPAGASVQSIVHYAQVISSKRFAHYDFGFWTNKEKYGQGRPPMYNIKAITAPVAAFWSDNDLLADPRDVARLTEQLPNLALNYRVPDPKFSHLDFMWAIDVKKLLYDRVVTTMKELWPEEGL